MKVWKIPKGCNNQVCQAFIGIFMKDELFLDYFYKWGNNKLINKVHAVFGKFIKEDFDSFRSSSQGNLQQEDEES